MIDICIVTAWNETCTPIDEPIYILYDNEEMAKACAKGLKPFYEHVNMCRVEKIFHDEIVGMDMIARQRFLDFAARAKQNKINHANVNNGKRSCMSLQCCYKSSILNDLEDLEKAYGCIKEERDNAIACYNCKYFPDTDPGEEPCNSCKHAWDNEYEEHFERKVI